MKLGSPQQALSCFGKAVAIDNTFYNAMYNANAMAVKLGLEVQFPDLKKKPTTKPRTEESFDFSDSVDEEGIFSS
jgi:hypothetical protein